MHRFALALSLCVLEACATPAALRGTGDIASLEDCLDEDPCPGGGSGAGRTIVYSVGAAALGIGVGALIYRIARPRPRADLRAIASEAARSP